MYTCFDIANYFLKVQDIEVGELISNMKLQKLVYYAQGYYLAINSTPLFYEKIYAWSYGPVCKDLWDLYKIYDKNPIPRPQSFQIEAIFDKKTAHLLEKIQNEYGIYSAWGLSNLTHKDSIWIEARDTGGVEITHESMEKYFLQKLIDKYPFFRNRACCKPDSAMNTQRVEGDFIYYKRENLYD